MEKEAVVLKTLFLMLSSRRCIKEKINPKRMDFEKKIQKVFGEDFVGLAETCAIFDKDLNENELSVFYSFSKDNEDSFKKAVQEGYSLIAIPKGITGEVIFSRMPKGFNVKLTPLEITSLMKKIIEPGCYLVKNQPIHTWSMAKMGGPQNPALELVLFFCTLRNLVNRKMQLAEQICLLCKDEVVRRGEKMPVCLKIDKAVGEIKAWESHMPLLSFLPVRKCS